MKLRNPASHPWRNVSIGPSPVHCMDGVRQGVVAVRWSIWVHVDACGRHVNAINVEHVACYNYWKSGALVLKILRVGVEELYVNA